MESSIKAKSTWKKYTEALYSFHILFKSPITIYHTILRYEVNELIQPLGLDGFSRLCDQIENCSNSHIAPIPPSTIRLFALLHLNAEYILWSLEDSYLEEILSKDDYLFQTLHLMLMSSEFFQVISQGFLKVWDENLLLKVLREHFKIKEFRPRQLEIILNTLQGKDVIALFPTGFGKSLLYMLPSAVQFGVTLVFSPLCSLVSDQERRLNSLGLKTAWLSSGLSDAEEHTILLNLARRLPTYDVIILTPEKYIMSGKIQNSLQCLHQRNLLVRIVLDECHCVSMWGHCFRPSYLDLCAKLSALRGAPFLCLTATATGAIINDLTNHLKMRDPLIVRESFNRPNIQFILHRKQRNTNKEILSIMKNEHTNDVGIVFCRTRRESENCSKFLKKSGVKVAPYHAQMDDDAKKNVLSQWMEGRLLVVCATIAFGMGKCFFFSCWVESMEEVAYTDLNINLLMKRNHLLGIDKSNVRFIIHQTMPSSAENFFQLSGRAGMIT